MESDERHRAVPSICSLSSGNPIRECLEDRAVVFDYDMRRFDRQSDTRVERRIVEPVAHDVTSIEPWEVWISTKALESADFAIHTAP